MKFLKDFHKQRASMLPITSLMVDSQVLLSMVSKLIYHAYIFDPESDVKKYFSQWIFFLRQQFYSLNIF